MGRRARSNRRPSDRAVTPRFRAEPELEFIARFPHAGTPVPGLPPELAVRRVPVRGFPFHVVYLELSDVIRVLAFAHDRRSPCYWYSRVPK